MRGGGVLLLVICTRMHIPKLPKDGNEIKLSEIAN